jgi:hypothetical protein
VGGLNQNKCLMEKSSVSVGEAMCNSLRLQLVMNGVWDIKDCIDKNKKFKGSIDDELFVRDSITEEFLLDLINHYYDFNEFGGLTEPFISNLMDTLMPKYMQTLFINDVQRDMLKMATERINEGFEN